MTTCKYHEYILREISIKLDVQKAPTIAPQKIKMKIHTYYFARTQCSIYSIKCGCQKEQKKKTRANIHNRFSRRASVQSQWQGKML